MVSPADLFSLTLLATGGLYATLWRLQQEDRGRQTAPVQESDSGSGA